MNLFKSAKKTANRKKIEDFFMAAGFSLLWVALAHTFFKTIYPNPFDSQASIPKGIFENVRLILWAMVLAPLLEEPLFRFAPINFMVARKLTKEAIFWGIVICAYLFAFWHGMNYYNILVQGVGGFIMGLYYWKHKSYTGSLLLHSVYNFYTIYLVYFLNIN